MEQQPYGGFSPGAYGASPAVVSPPPPMLRPLSTGEILDRTMALYRQNFWLFAGIGAGVAAVGTLSSAVQLIVAGTVQSPFLSISAKDPMAAQEAMRVMMRSQIYSMPLLLAFLVAYGISKAATVKAVADLSHGQSTSAIEAYRSVGGRWLRWTGIVLRQYLAALWPMAVGGAVWFGAVLGATLLFKNSALAIGLIAILGFLVLIAGFVLGIVNYLRVTLAETAAVVEDLGVNAAMRRSRALVAGRKGRIFLALLLVYALYMVAGGLQLPFMMLAAASRGAGHVLLTVGMLVVNFVVTSLVLPVASVALTLLYLDERVRREGYDIELLLRRSATPAAPVMEI